MIQARAFKSFRGQYYHIYAYNHARYIFHRFALHFAVAGTKGKIKGILEKMSIGRKSN